MYLVMNVDSSSAYGDIRPSLVFVEMTAGLLDVIHRARVFARDGARQVGSSLEEICISIDGVAEVWWTRCYLPSIRNRFGECFLQNNYGYVETMPDSLREVEAYIARSSIIVSASYLKLMMRSSATRTHAVSCRAKIDDLYGAVIPVPAPKWAPASDKPNVWAYAWLCSV